jgi:hypothetical protein
MKTALKIVAALFFVAVCFVFVLAIQICGGHHNPVC